MIDIYAAAKKYIFGRDIFGPNRECIWILGIPKNERKLSWMSKA